jgi:hypothetical protein
VGDDDDFAFKGLLISLAAAFMLAVGVVWTAEAGSKPRPKPVPPDRIAQVQILGLNETHGQLVPLSERNPDGTRTAVGGAAALTTTSGFSPYRSSARVKTSYSDVKCFYYSGVLDGG